MDEKLYYDVRNIYLISSVFKVMSKIKINQLQVNKSQLKDLKDFETIKIIGGYDEENNESSRDIIQKAMTEAVTRSDMSRNRIRAFKTSS